MSKSKISEKTKPYFKPNRYIHINTYKSHESLAHHIAYYYEQNFDTIYIFWSNVIDRITVTVKDGVNPVVLV